MNKKLPFPFLCGRGKPDTFKIMPILPFLHAPSHVPPLQPSCKSIPVMII